MSLTWKDWFFRQDLQIINKRVNLVRTPAMGAYTSVDGVEYLDFQSNDYLGLSRAPQLINALIDATQIYGVGSTGAIPLGGYTNEHEQLKQEIALWLGYDKCLLFASGYQMNVSLFSALSNHDVTIWLDRNCHASHIDGVLLSRAKFKRFDADNVNDIYQEIVDSTKLQLIVTEATYSMNGTNNNLLAIMDVKNQFPERVLLIVDDAHGVACLGATGAGTVEQLMGKKINYDILLATFGKALGSHGGFLCANQQITDYLQHTVRSQIFSTSLPPAIVAASRAAVNLMSTELACQLRLDLQQKTSYFKQAIANTKLELYNKSSNISPIQLIICKNEQQLENIYHYLFNNNILVGKIKYPTVPQNTPRLRISINIKQNYADLDYLIKHLSIAFERYQGYDA